MSVSFALESTGCLLTLSWGVQGYFFVIWTRGYDQITELHRDLYCIVARHIKWELQCYPCPRNVSFLIKKPQSDYLKKTRVYFLIDAFVTYENWDCLRSHKLSDIIRLVIDVQHLSISWSMYI